MIGFLAGFMIATLVALLLQGRMYIAVARATFRRISDMSPAVKGLKDRIASLTASVEKLSRTIGTRAPQDPEDRDELVQLNASVDGLKTWVDGLDDQLHNPGTGIRPEPTGSTDTPVFPISG